MKLIEIKSVEEIKVGMTLYTIDLDERVSIETVECIDNDQLFSVDLESGDRHRKGKGEYLPEYLSSYQAVYQVVAEKGDINE